METAASGEEALEKLAQNCYEIMLLDLRMPGMDGMEVLRRVSQQFPELRVIIITAYGSLALAVEAMRLGAVDFLQKPFGYQELMEAIHRALELGRRARESEIEQASLAKRLAQLTEREREVFELIVTGLLNKQVADLLGTVEKTVKVHRARVMEKMQAKSLADLVHMAGRLGIPAGGA